METFSHNDGQLLVTAAGVAAAPQRLLLLHGWGQPAASLLPTISTLLNKYEVVLCDTPGNGVAPLPPASWGIADYVTLLAAFVATLPPKPTIIICHSFGARLAMHLAARGAIPHLQKIVVIGGHGLKPIRPLLKQLKIFTLIRITKILGLMDKIFGLGADGLKAKWAARVGSADYKNAGKMRHVLVRVVADDVTPILPQVQVPVLLLYGALDDQTPPAMGRRYAALLPNARYVELPAADHYSVLTSNAGLVQAKIKEFI